ncbi:MAG: beta-ketoacyl synthase N-terminal-like domain-containing protein [Bacteroidota bacterium]
MQTPISISGIASISPLGISTEEVWRRYLSGTPSFKIKEFSGEPKPIASLGEEAEQQLSQLRTSNSSYKNLDKSVLMAMIASRKAMNPGDFEGKQIGINIGSSRGATELFEKYHTQFQKTRKVSPYTSPTTTLGNISSWVGQDLGIDGVHIGHSVTCSTALHAVLNGIAWLKADMADVFLVGGSEAAITPFTIAQMEALKLYSHAKGEFPCESMLFDKKRNTMVLGEGAAVAVLEKGISERTQAVILGYGFASEPLEHNSSISKNADCFQRSMQRALDSAGLETVDAVIMHAPGTVKGDCAEFNAIQEVFRNKLPALTTNKYLVGHTFGASGMMSMEMAVLMLQHNKLIFNPFYGSHGGDIQHLKTVMVNAVGFGGNAVSILVTK